jgi:voltage-gated potassium channel
MKTHTFGPFQFLVLALSIYVLLALSIEAIFPVTTQTHAVLEVVDTVVCVIFLLDFVVRLRQATNRLEFLKWGWVDLISSIPTLDALRWGRAVRVARVLRFLRAFKSVKVIWITLFRSRAKGTLATAVFACIVMITVASIGVLHFESVPEGNIKTASDALWWSAVTITTVGYGDRFPITPEGRVLALFLMTAGVGLFGIFTAVLASWFVENSTAQLDKNEELALEIAALRRDIAALLSRSETREETNTAAN